MLEIGKANEVKFKVGVNGTQAPPSVRLVLSTPQTELGFTAEKLLGGGDDDWFAEVKIPEDLQAGEYDLRVEVVVNNRLFTPIKRKVAIGNTEPAMAYVPPTSEDVAPAHPTQKPKQTETWEGEGGALPEVPEIPQPLPSKPLPSETKEKKSLMKQFAEDKSPAKIGKHAPVKAKPAKKEYKVETPMPKPLKNKKEPIRIKMSEIAAESEKRFDKVLKESASYRKPGVSVAPININHQTPTALKKGEVVYE